MRKTLAQLCIEGNHMDSDRFHERRKIDPEDQLPGISASSLNDFSIRHRPLPSDLPSGCQGNNRPPTLDMLPELNLQNLGQAWSTKFAKPPEIYPRFRENTPYSTLKDCFSTWKHVQEPCQHIGAPIRSLTPTEIRLLQREGLWR